MVMSSIDLRAMAALIQSMTTAAATLDGSARSIKSTSERVFGPTAEAQKISSAAGWVRAEIPGLRRRLALAQQIEAQARGFQPTVQIDETRLSTVPPDAAIKQGAAAAQRVKESGKELEPALIAHIAQYQDDPYFAAGFAQNLTPAELAKLVLNISNAQRYRPRSNAEDMIAGTKKWGQDYTAMIAAIGTTLGTATRNTGELALPADYAMQWVNTIIAEPKGNTEVPIPLGQGAAASLILRYGNYSTSFLNQVSSKVYDYDRSLGEHADRQWAKRSTHGLTSPFSGPLLPDNSPQPDPIANILQALAHNPQAAQDFFDVANPHAALTEGLKVSERAVNDRLKYLLQDRSWNPSGAAALGSALEVATTNWRDHGPNGETSAIIAAQTFALIGERTARGDDWTMPSAMRPGVARILASYMPDVYRMRGVDNPAADPTGGAWTIDEDDPAFPAGQPYGAKLDPKLLEGVIATLGENESDIQLVTAGVLATQQVRMAYALQKSLKDNPNTPVMIIKGVSVPFLQNASSESAGVLGWVVNTAYTGDKADEELQKKRAEMLSKTLSIVDALPILQIHTTKDWQEWAKFAYEDLKGRALEEITKAPKGTASGVYGEMDERSKTALRDATLSLFLQSGYLRPEHFSAANSAVGGATTYVAPPLKALMGRPGPRGEWIPDQPPRFNTIGREYRAWARTYGDSQWMSTNVTTAYNEQFPNIR
jgi:hypothetical protein